MALTTEQVFALGILYNKLATIVYGEDGPKANNLQNATMYPLMEVAQLILRAHTEHRITPELDRLGVISCFVVALAAEVHLKGKKNSAYAPHVVNRPLINHA